MRSVFVTFAFFGLMAACCLSQTQPAKKVATVPQTSILRTIAPTQSTGEVQVNPSTNFGTAPISSTLTSQLPSSGYVDACTLIPAADASRVMGTSFTGPTYSGKMQPGEPLSECEYASGSKQARISVFRYAGPATALDAFKALIQLLKTEKYFALVQGLGDLGFQNRNGAYFVKDYYIVNLLIFYDEDLTAQINRDKAISLAMLAASRLP